MGEKKAYTCPNVACQKTFSVPLKTLDVQTNPSEPFYACPVCLTKIETQEQAKMDKTVHQAAAKPVETPHKQSSKGDKPAGCQFHLGYLSTRGKKEIPDGCLTCRDIVECMLNKMRTEQ
jgi:hypothetical protein